MRALKGPVFVCEKETCCWKLARGLLDVQVGYVVQLMKACVYFEVATPQQVERSSGLESSLVCVSYGCCYLIAHT